MRFPQDWFKNSASSFKNGSGVFKITLSCKPSCIAATKSASKTDRVKSPPDLAHRFLGRELNNYTPVWPREQVAFRTGLRELTTITRLQTDYARATQATEGQQPTARRPCLLRLANN